MSIDNDNVKDVLSVTQVALSHHKKSLPEDSDSCDDIGLSSEEEAEDLPDVPHICRKYQTRQKTKTTERKDTSNSGTMTSPRRSPRLSTPSATVTTDQPSTSTATGPSTVVQVAWPLLQCQWRLSSRSVRPLITLSRDYLFHHSLQESPVSQLHKDQPLCPLT